MTVIWASQALTEEGWREDVRVAVDDGGKIASVVCGKPREGHAVGILLPAPVNAHSHAFQRAMAGLTERRGDDPTDSFWTWRELMFRFLDQLTPEHVEAITAYVQMEMPRSRLRHQCRIPLPPSWPGWPMPMLALAKWPKGSLRRQTRAESG